MSRDFYNFSKIPQTWKFIKLKYVLTFSDEKSTHPSDEKNLSLTQNGIIQKDVNLNEGQIAQSYDKYILTKKGQISMNPMDLLSGWVDISPFDGLISPAYYTFLLKDNFDVKFVNYFFQSNYYRKTFFKLGKGVASHDNFGRWVLNPEELKNIYFLYPTFKKQKLIPSYLDKIVNQRELLKKKVRKKIKLLKDFKKSYINTIVTEGIDSKNEMKLNNLNWYKRMPKNWELKKLKFLSTISLSSVDRHEYKNENKVSVCHYTDVYKNDYINKSISLPTGTCTDNEFKKFELKRGDIVITKDSETAEDIAIPTFIEDDLENTVCGYHLALIRIKNEEINPEYLYRYIESKSVRDYFNINSNGVTRYGLKELTIKDLFVPIPSSIEQDEIVKKIREFSHSTNKLISLYLNKIKNLENFKKSIVTECVSGQSEIIDKL